MKPIRNKPKFSKPRQFFYYFPRWVWQEISARYPDKYNMTTPVYKDCPVILT